MYNYSSYGPKDIFFPQEDLLKQTNLQKNFLTKIYTTIHIITKQKTVN